MKKKGWQHYFKEPYSNMINVLSKEDTIFAIF